MVSHPGTANYPLSSCCKAFACCAPHLCLVGFNKTPIFTSASLCPARVCALVLEAGPTKRFRRYGSGLPTYVGVDALEAVHQLLQLQVRDWSLLTCLPPYLKTLHIYVCS